MEYDPEVDPAKEQVYIPGPRCSKRLRPRVSGKSPPKRYLKIWRWNRDEENERNQIKPKYKEFANVPDYFITMDELVTFFGIQVVIS
jgi:hypothetical protein